MLGRLLLAALALLPPGGALAFECRLLDAAGKPVAGAQISVVGESGASRTDPEGRFTIAPDPLFPATLIVIGSGGELFPPVHLPVPAAEIRLEPVYRESVTVSVGATPNTEGTPASAAVTLGAEQIEQRKPAHVSEAIAGTPGVSLRGEGPPAVPVIRGLAGGRTLLLVDDARIVTERRAGPSATFINPASLGSIEISRGPGSVAYGSDAIGGVVHLRPRDPVPGESDYRYDASFSAGGTDEQSVAIEASVPALGGAVLGSAHFRSAGDASAADGSTIENSQYRDRGMILRLVRDSSWGRMRTGIMSTVARDVGAPSTDAAATVYPDERATLVTFGLDLDQPGSWTAAELRASAGTYAITTDRIRPSGVESATVKARDVSLRLSGERALARSLVTTGIDLVSRFDLRAIGSIDDADRYDAGAFATWSGDLGRVQAGVGGRADFIAVRNRGGWFGTRSRDDVAFSGFAAATARLGGGVALTLQGASGYREPSLSDRYFRGVSGRGFVTGNPELEPERSIQFDGNMRWSGAQSRLALYAYHYRIRDLVERYRSGTDFFFRNRGAATIRGVEVEAARRLPRGLEIQLGGALARGEDADSGEPLDDIAAPTLHATLQWASSRASLFASSSVYSSDDRPGPVETERPGHAEVEIGGGWRFSPAFEIRLLIRNATNSDHFGSPDAAAALAPGRSVMIGVNR